MQDWGKKMFDLLFDPFLPLDSRATRIVLGSTTSRHLEAVLLSQHAAVQWFYLDIWRWQVDRMHAQWWCQEGFVWMRWAHTVVEHMPATGWWWRYTVPTTWWTKLAGKRYRTSLSRSNGKVSVSTLVNPHRNTWYLPVTLSKVPSLPFWEWNLLFCFPFMKWPHGTFIKKNY